MKVKLSKYPRGDAKRRVSVEVDSFDSWSLDHTLALIILPALIQLKHTKHGVPSEFVDDKVEDYHDQRVFDFMQDDKDEVFEAIIASFATCVSTSFKIFFLTAIFSTTASITKSL